MLIPKEVETHALARRERDREVKVPSGFGPWKMIGKSHQIVKMRVFPKIRGKPQNG